MRHAPLVAAAILALTACSGDGTKPPSNITAGPPSSVAVQAGDNQSANVGTAVGVAPSVIVSDRDGHPVSAVSVTFAIDSGGGSIANGSAVTGSDGVASAGAWTLGFGLNRLRATVGSLTPVFFSANGTGDLPAGVVDVQPSGGTLVVSKPGTPIDGMQVAFPAGAVGGSLHLAVGYGDTTGAPHKSGIRFASPVISLTSSVGFSDVAGPVKLTVPVSLNPGEWPVAILFDRSTGAIETLPTIPVGSNRVVTFARSLNSGDLPPAAGVAAGLARPAAIQSATASIVVQLVIGAVAYSALQADFDTGYRPTADDWEFDQVFTAVGTHATDLTAGMAITAAWYYDHLKSRGALNGQYQQARGVEWSNPYGYKLSAAAALAVDYQGAIAYQSALLAVIGPNDPSLDSLTFLAIKAGFFTTNRPYILLAHDPAGPTPPLTLAVYATQGNTLKATIGTAASGINAPRTLTLANQTFGPLTYGLKDPVTGSYTTYVVPHISPTGLSSGISASTLGQLWQSFFSKTIGQGQWPTFEVATRDYRPVVDTLFVPDDTTRFWSECTGAACTFAYPVTGNFQPKNTVAGSIAYLQSAGTWSVVGPVLGGGLKLKDQDDLRRVGLAHLVASDPSGATAPARSGGDWTEFVVKTKRLDITPQPLKAIGGIDFTLTASYVRTLPLQPVWIWDLGDGRTLQSNTNTITAQYPVSEIGNSYDIKVSLKSGTTLEATGHDAVTVLQQIVAWQFQSATLQGSTLPPGGIGSLKSDTTAYNILQQFINGLQTAPGDNVLFALGSAVNAPSCLAAVVWQSFPPGQATDTPGQATVGLLGVCGDPNYTGSAVLGPMGTGTLIGSATDVPQPNARRLPGGSINATMQNKDLNGTFVLRTRFSTGDGSYTVSFHAVQIRP